MKPRSRIGTFSTLTTLVHVDVRVCVRMGCQSLRLWSPSGHNRYWGNSQDTQSTNLNLWGRLNPSNACTKRIGSAKQISILQLVASSNSATHITL